MDDGCTAQYKVDRVLRYIFYQVDGVGNRSMHFLHFNASTVLGTTVSDILSYKARGGACVGGLNELFNDA